MIRPVLMLALAGSAATGLSGCAPRHFDTVVEIAASKHPRQCAGKFSLKALSSSAYRVDACEGALYYSCYFARKSMGHAQCCYEVKDEAEATAFITLIRGEQTCEYFIN